MRFYNITITDNSGAILEIDGAKMQFTSFEKTIHGGYSKPGALNIEMDIPIVTEDIPAGNALIKIWGIDLGLVNKASNLNFQNIAIMAGMKPGLPLATQQANYSPIRNGIVFQGTILQAIGNWQGNEQTLDLIVTTRLTASQTSTAKPKPIAIDCKAGTSLQDAIKIALGNAGIKSDINLDTRLVPAAPGLFSVYPDFGIFAQDMNLHSKRILNDTDYLGIKFIKTPDGYNCTDNTKKTEPIKIDFNDLIGQPVWLDYNTVQLKCVMRSDIRVGSTVKMPESNIIQGKFFAPKNGIAYTGDGFVNSVRHLGNFRQADANSWVTVINVLPNRKSTT